MGKYIDFEDVRIRLIGKVSFTEDEDDENKMSKTLANRLIDEAEGVVEYDLSPRYAAPFTVKDGSFADLPTSPTKEILKTLCELKAVERILETDFGSGTAVNGDKYKDSISKRYTSMVDRILAKKKDKGADAGGWMYPPLPGLDLNYMNTEADDGYMGSVIVASGTETMGYAAHQVNNPAVNFWTGWPW